jgi:hypothetical protein
MQELTFCLNCGLEGHQGKPCPSDGDEQGRDVYAHVLSANELGISSSPRADGSRGGTSRRGRSCYISPNLSEGFFPKLRADVLNDKVNIVIIPPNLGEIEVEMCFYNSKLLGNKDKGRFEIRVKLPLEAGPNGMYRPGDIIIFHRVHANPRPKYAIDLISPSSGEYEAIRLAMGSSTHARLDLRKVRGGIPGHAETSTSFPDPPSGGMVTEGEGFQSLSDEMFETVMLNAYNGTCPASARCIRYHLLASLALTWLVPERQGGRRIPGNTVPLDPGLSWALLRGMFTFREGTEGAWEIEVHPLMRDDSVLGRLHGGLLAPPVVPKVRLASNCVEWHRLNVFGLFAGMAKGPKPLS